MKILHLSTENDWRGGEQQLIYLHTELLKNNIQSIVFCKDGSSVHKYCTKNNLPNQPFNINSAYDLKAVFRLINFCKKERFDLIHAHTSKGHTLGIIGAILGNKPKIILSRRVDFKVKDNWFSKFKYNHKKIYKIICVSNTIEKITTPEIKDKSKLTTIHSGIDLTKFQSIPKSDFLQKKYQLPAKATLVGNASAIADHKDYFTFIDAAEKSLAMDNNLFFFIIGDGPLFSQIKNYIDSKSLSEKIIMTGFIDEIGKALKSLDIFLFTSKTEGLGTSVLDAMAAEIPIVATAAGGVPEMIADNHNGFLAEVKDSSALAERVVQLVNDKKLQSTFKENALKIVSNFSYQTTATKTIKIYEEALNN